jgi:hypothetical protein
VANEWSIIKKLEIVTVATAIVEKDIQRLIK